MKFLLGAAAGAAALCLCLFYSGRLLVCNDLQRSDVIFVDGGDDRSYWKAVELARAGFGRDIVLNLDENEYGDEDRLATEFIARTAPDLKTHITLLGDDDVRTRLSKLHAKSVLIVAPESESRVLRLKYRRQMPELQWHVAYVAYPQQFGRQWWRHRAWAKRFAWTVCAWLRVSVGRSLPSLT